MHGGGGPARAPAFLPMAMETQPGWMRPSSATDGIDELRRRLELDGYLMLRALLPREAVDAGRQRIAAQMGSAGWLVDAESLTVDVDTLEWDSPHPPNNIGGANVQRLLHEPACSRVLEAPELATLFTQLFREPAATLDFKWLRAVRPGAVSGVHCDNVYMGRGSLQLHTVWIPWMDVPPSLGGLAVVSGSNRLPGFQRYARVQKASLRIGRALQL
eukprot:COSAG05_NODE_4948_length_1317_cov_0.930213_2_plen_216_part_00